MTAQVNDLNTRHNILSFISDTHKEAYGFRPRGYDWDAYSIKELEALADNLAQEAEAEAYRVEAEATEAYQGFERAIASTVEAGAGNRATAIKWLYDAEEENNLSAEGWIWKMGMLFYPDWRTVAKEIVEAVGCRAD